MALVLGHAAVGNLGVGSEILIKYSGFNEWHARLLLAEVGNDVFIVITPDGDVFPEDIKASNRDIEQWRRRPGDRSVPFGVAAADAYDFGVLPSAAELAHLQLEAAGAARRERARLGLPDLAPAVPPAPPAGVPGAGPPGAIAPAAGAAAAVAPALFVPHAPILPPAGGGTPPAGAAAAAGALHTALNPPPSGPPAHDDARTLPVKVGDDGERHRDFKDAVMLCKKSEFADWPVKGPRTAGWLARAMSEHSQNAMAHHARFMAYFKLSPGDPIALQHENYCKILHAMLVYDQLDVTNLACAELVCRQLQLLEEKQMQSSTPQAESASVAEESSLFMGTASAHGAVLVCPELKSWVSSELSREASILKERRKAREERTLARNNKQK